MNTDIDAVHAMVKSGKIWAAVEPFIKDSLGPASKL